MTSEPETGVALSVVMTTRGDRELLRLTVPAALRAGFDPSRDEMLVVIDGPGHHENAILDDLTRLSPSVRVLTVPENRGAARARLFGVSRARHEIVVLVDDDVALAPGALDEHRRFHDQAGGLPTLLVGAMPVVESDRTSIDDLPTSIYAEAYRETVRSWQVAPATIAQTLWMGHLSVRRADVLAAETVMPTVRMDYFEDTDLGLRLSVVGVRMHYSDRAGADHHYRKDLEAFLREGVQRGRSAAALGRRWPTVGVGPTAPSGQSMVRTVTSAVFRRPWAVRLVLAWLRAGSGAVTARRRSHALLARHLVEQAWFDQELQLGQAWAVRHPVVETAGQENALTSRFAKSTRRA